MAAERPAYLPPEFQTPEQLDPPSTGLLGSTEYHDIEVAGPLGFRPIRMDLMVPAGHGPVPVVLFIHGGAFMFGSRRVGPFVPSAWTALLERGIAVAAVEYRLSGEAIFPACLHDLKAAVRWLRRFGPQLGVRGDAIGAWGESAGGHLTAFLGLNNTDPALNGEGGVQGVSSDVQVAVPWYPPTEFLSMDRDAVVPSLMPHDAADSPESLLVGGAIQERPEATTFASPTSHVEAGRAAPMLFMHGMDDRVVPYPQSVRLAELLEAAGADVRIELVPGADHVFQGADIAPLLATAADFLAARLGALAPATAG